MAKGTGSHEGLGVPLYDESTIEADDAANDVLSLKGASGQTADFLVCMDSDEAEKCVIDKDGNITGTLNGASIVKKSQTVAYDAFTDGGATVGTFALTDKIPVGAFFLCASITVLVGFAGDTSAVITVGDGTDVDRYNTGTPNVFADIAAGLALGIPSGVQYHAAEKTITLTVTTNADFTSVSAGSITIEFFYLT